jgi:uncharacterized protein
LAVAEDRDDSADEAYFVKCGRDTMSADDIQKERVRVEVGFAPLRRLEFIVLRIGLATAGA